MILKDLKIDLPKNWQEISRSGNENQSYIKIYHISPLSKVDPKILQDQSLPSPGPNITVTKVGVPQAGPPPLKAYYEAMKMLLSVGYLPGWTLEKLDEHYKKMTEGYHPGEGDFSGDISITQFQTEEIARQYFKNTALMPTRGFDVPIPGGVQIPGMPKDMTFIELLEGGIYEKYMPEHLEKMKEYMPKEQAEKVEKQMKELKKYMSKEQLEKMRTALKEFQEKQASHLEKSGAKYKEGKYLGCQAIYAEGKNPSPPPKPRSPSQKTSETGGGGFETRLDPLPKITKPYLEKLVMYQAMLVKNFVITGSLLWAISSLPPGNTPCYSLAQFKKKTTTYREFGEVFTDIAIVPVVSNYAEEGYLHKEEVEGILKKIITALN